MTGRRCPGKGLLDQAFVGNPPCDGLPQIRHESKQTTYYGGNIMCKKALITPFFLALLVSACGGGGGSTSSSVNVNTANNPLSPPLIADFTPKSEAEGGSVHISGLMFSPVPAANTVSFNGVAATVQSATEMEIVLNVPVGALSGPITVTTAGGSATTSEHFTVLTDPVTPGAAWTTRTTGLRDTPSGLAWDGSKYVAVGGSIVTSTDIVRWQERKTFGSLYDVEWNGQRFVAVGLFGDIVTSADGLTWTTHSTGSSADLYGVAHSDALWVAVGESGTIQTSADGENWTARTSPVPDDLTDVAWSGSQFVAVGNDGVVLTSPDGITWSAQVSGTGDSFTAVAATPSLMVASTFPYPGSTSAIYTSSDGVSWTQQAPGIGTFNDIIYAGAQWLAVSSYSVARSVDGVTWNVTSNAPGNAIGYLQSVIHDGSRYVAVGSFPDGSVYTSPDGVSWSLRASKQDLRAVARRPADGRLVAVATSDVSMISTDEGASWEFGGLNSFVGDLFLDVAWFAPLNAFVALVQEGANEGIYTSTDGLAWTRLANAALNGRLGASPSRLVSVGWDLAGEGIATSADGVTWSMTYTTPAAESLQEVFWDGSQFIAPGENGTIVTSSDGTAWTKQSSGVTHTLYGAASSPFRLVAVGAGGTVLTSDDGGTTWSQQSSGTPYTLRSVAWTGAEFVATGNNGTAVRSTDGLNWTVQATPYTDVLFGSDPFHLQAMSWTDSGGRLVGLGTRGLVTTSP
jgi:photosystem II stability/assembly factor-like uncharacterized protein